MRAGTAFSQRAAGLTLPSIANEIYERPVWPEQKPFQQQQAHLDIEVRSQEELQSAIHHARDCGAVMAKEQFGYNEEKQTDDWVTLIDPVGHPFCFVIW